ncbi:MAG: M23 family metallopeptidase [Tessaracoccus sp.]|uniref:M23 family metallopeptidase n=1 Tax=Tessaracoccus sp. TaxID=1971211 RepID=UPI001EBC2157|nr:M23 family metallopeptidase [Tessaracoccus sp.]MBK7821705.1 M23 family metallopeptidase [Tessaracoccus sp.]
MNDNASPRARRAVAAFDDVYELEAPAGRARRSSVAGLSKRIVALGITSVVTVSAVFAFAFASRGLDANASSDTSEAAVPAAAASAAAEAFGDRSAQVSRDAVRANLSEAVADAAAKDRNDQLDASVTAVAEDETEKAAAQRDKLMDADMKLVAKQAKKLKKEAEEAAKRLAAAQAAAGGDLGDLSAADIANLTSKGGSMPVKSNYRVGAGYGATGSWSRYHTGQDFPAPVGTPIYAAASGVVLSPTNGGWAGINVVIQHSNGGATLYAHMSSRLVSPGTTVKAGQLIGYVGTTGRSFGAHLHFEYYQPGVTPGDVYKASNPLTFLRSLGVRI